MTPFMLILVFVLGVLIGAINKISINISHKHVHTVEKKDKPVDNSYNSSYGDPEKMMYLDQQFGKDER